MPKTKIDNSDVLKYDKKTQREHILIRPDTYIGDIEPTKEAMWVYENNKMVFRDITYTPGFLKIFDEGIVNSRDAHVNDPTCDTIKIEYNEEEGFISIYNNGDMGIPIDEHPEHKMLIPTMIFGELLTSSNYDDTQRRTTGGRNGIGSKAINIFSKKFMIEIVDGKRMKKMTQIWEDNMSIVNKPKVKDIKKGKSYVKITFYPDCKRFGIDDLKNDHKALFHRRAVDIAGTSKKLSVFFNGEKIKVNNFKDYIHTYYEDADIIYDSNERWEVGCIYKQDEGNKVISFVNSINTRIGGTHCNYIINNIVKTLIDDYIKKKTKDAKISPTMIKDNLIFFINSIIENPAFSSQTKETLTSKVENFGSTFTATKSFITKLSKTGIVQQIVELAKFKETANLQKTDGKKQVRLLGIPKLEDANKAGTSSSHKCTLILTEGDSAKATAVAGTAVVGKDYYGVFPLKGKLLNVREATVDKLMNNDEINHLKQIIGLKQNANYANNDEFMRLRYGHILILTDQDLDGIHIRGLLINFIHSMWPELAKREGFIQTLNTPIVKATKGKQTKIFYSMSEFEEWRQLDEAKSWTTKYYKGLGTSTAQEAREYFQDIDDKIITYFWEAKQDKGYDSNDEYVPKYDDDDAIMLAFAKNRSDERKNWLMSYNKNIVLDNCQKDVSYYDFIHKDLIHFSNYDVIRSIPSVIDGFKPSQRKILFGSLKKLNSGELKVSQLAGYISAETAYHHGEASLIGAIVNMAQDFVGSNNINLLMPNGQFGTRLLGGKDHASPRYIFTALNELTKIIFNPYDSHVLNHQDDDGMPIEPEYYAPIIPMVLINGTEGIGTGFSTYIAPFNPLDVIENMRCKINNKGYITMNPWWNGFKGTITRYDENSYEIQGNYTIDKNKLIITELPVGVWTDEYKAFLERILSNEAKPKKETKTKQKKEVKTKKQESVLLDFKNNSNDHSVNFVLEFRDGYLEKNKVEKEFKLSKPLTTNNMYLYNSQNIIHKYETVYDIIDDYYIARYDIYVKRRKFMLKQLKKQLEMISYKVKFILMIINKELNINNKKRSVIEEELTKHKFPKLSIKEEEPSYGYLLTMPIHNLTYEKIEELKKQEKECNVEYEKLKAKTPKDIWLEELDELEDKYIKWFEYKQKQIESESKQKSKSKPKSKPKKRIIKIDV